MLISDLAYHNILTKMLSWLEKKEIEKIQRIEVT